MEPWNRILSCVKKRIANQTFDIWFKPTSLQKHDPQGKRLFVRVPNKRFKHWLTENYAEILLDSLRELDLADFQISFLVGETDGPDAEGGKENRDKLGLREPCADAPPCNLNPKYTFGSFVVGISNQFAHAAALAVAEQPSKAYNPLFIYGGVGLGKTHLMHAIGHYIKKQFPGIRLNYMSSERFVNELINSIRYDKTIQFRDKYRNIDVLLIDDIQFLAGKERTQEEFFHTFNALYDAQKQIIISSDAPPKQIPTLEERLHSRFEWGLIADIQPPDLETKIAILYKKAESEGVLLPDDVALFIATNIKSNVRELEGSLIRLVAYSSLIDQEVSLPFAQKVLKNLTEDRARVISIDLIQKTVAGYYALKVTELKARDNSRRIAEPRQIAMFLCKELTGSSLPQIGKEFGGKHHTTVLHSIRKIAHLRHTDSRINSALNKLTASIH